jgi:hypothetical protein
MFITLRLQALDPAVKPRDDKKTRGMTRRVAGITKDTKIKEEKLCII